MNLCYHNISPIDNRYKESCDSLRPYVSDFGINKIRCEVEVKYFLMVMKNILKVNLPQEDISFMESIYSNFCDDDITEIRLIELNTNHDIKAIEYFIKNKIKNRENIVKYSEYIHFALTSQDINSVVNSLSVKRSITNIILPNIKEIIYKLEELSSRWKHQYMLSRTHGQPAVTTSMGKELNVFSYRLNIQLEKLTNLKYSTKFGGAVGNLNAHYFCFEDFNWEKILYYFVGEQFGLVRNKYTTQVDNYDNLCEIFDIIKRINTILLDMNQDIWLYISQNYFKIKINNNETGSSTMPHKVNPINFENSEGNIHLANSILNMFSSKLPISRLQRDLTDSTISRNIGVGFSYCLIAYDSLLKGLEKLEINSQLIDNELNNNWSILMEAIQCIMKTEFIENSYEIVKDKCRGKDITKEDYLNIVEELPISDKSKNKLRNLTPHTYTGMLNK